MTGQGSGHLNEPKPPVAYNLRRAQSEALLSNRELAQMLGVSERLLGKWRSGESTPSWKYVVALGLALGRTPDWFYADHAEDRAA